MSAHDIATSPTLPARRAPLLSHRWVGLPVVLAGTFMVVLDFFIVNVAMPAMQADLRASTGAIEWVVAGALSTTQQVGNALGVAVTGVLFFGALHAGFAHAFEVSLVQLAVLCVAVAVLTRLLPRASGS